MFVNLLCLGQNPFYLSLDKTSGLPSNSVYDIFQDSKGFMWFATGKGICRYDGTNYKTFISDEQTSKSGSCLSEDSFGRIWYANFDGFLYYVEKGVLKALPQSTSLGYYRFGIIKEELFLIQPNAVFVYDLKTLKIKNKIPIADKMIQFCYATQNHFYLLADSLYEFSSAKKFQKYTLPTSFKEEISAPILSHLNQKLIINTKSNAASYFFEKGKFTKTKFNIATNFIQNTSVTEDRIWICTPNGVYKNNLVSATTTPYFTQQNISYVFKDRNQNFWISTLNKGVLFVDDFENNYIDLEPRPLSLSLGKKDIYIGGEKEVIYQLNTQNLSCKTIFETQNNHAINQIFTDTINNKVFFNSFKFNILNQSYQITNDYSIAVKDIKKIDHKYFSFAASGIMGLFYVDEKLKSNWDFIFEKNKLEKFTGFNQSMLLINSNGKSTEYISTNNTIYYATNNGLIAITNDGKSREIKYKNQTLYLSRIQKYKNNIVGLSTSEKLYLISDKDQISLLQLPNFIKNEKFNRFFIQNQYCYLFAVNGVYELDLNTNKVQKVLSLSNDLEATDVVLENNRLYFATSKGIVIKNRNEIGNYSKPKLIINEILINGKRREINQISQLNPDENDLDIYFSTLSSIPNESYSVSYKINDADWKILDADTKNLKLSSLATGQYSIQMVINYNDQQIDLHNINFNIQKHFWQSTAFIFLMVVIALVLFYLFYLFQIKKIEKQNQILLEKNELEKNLNLSTLKAIKSQMNPHFFYNALNTIQSYILANDKKQAVNYLSKFSSLTRNILEMTEKEFITISEEITTISLYLDIEKARFDEDFDYTIHSDHFGEIEHEKIPSMLLQPYIENAVKHGLLHKSGHKKLDINFSKIEAKIRITIDDNGIGRQKSTELNAIKNKNHQSFATNAMQNRVELLNQNKTNKITINFIDKQNQSHQSMGTTVVIEIPLNTN